MSGEQVAWERLKTGDILNERYRILRILGKGGMGTVYMAEHLHLNTLVAIKEVRLPKASDSEQEPKEQEAVLHEAQVLVQLHHPNLPKVTDAFIENDKFYLVMEYIEGVTLETFLRNQERTHLDVSKVVAWGIQIADVLDYLHRQDPPIIFRDLKPSNVMLRADGSICLIDFGIARRFQPGASRDTALLGSVGYSPPEQFGKRQTDMRSDIYALGATLHHLLTGHDPASQPFKFPPMRSLNPKVPESLERLVAACLALEPEARPQTAREVKEALENIQKEIALSGSLSGSYSPSGSVAIPSASAALTSSHLESTTKKWAQLGIVVGAIIVIGLVGVVIAVTRQLHKEAKPSVVVTTQVPSSPTLPTPDTSPPSNSTTTPLTTVPVEPTAPPPQPLIDTSTVTLAPQPALQKPNNPVLPITVSGSIVGHAGTNAMIVVYFYRDDKALVPLLAADPTNNSYATTNGQLGIAAQLTVTSDPQPFTWNTAVPLKEIPIDAVSAGQVYARAEVLIGGQRICISPIVNLILYLPPPTPANGSNPSNSISGGMSTANPLYGTTGQP
ncbi:serine/threonine protein kinase [Chthonomonas calidirosea]|uniref:serine/threonine protein kinase n=1 Tax=Chthonomonas calidirosea TaxID=454171 RepID=UPI0006DD3C90|nr:serine/threonine-protein kinase [Chthonomonas calidirosea]CEK19314.1 serine/threonine protein kinase [Chthonomonas calidirosea]